MDRRQIALLLTLRSLGISLSVATFDDRMVLQKAISLAQAAGSDLGYHFRWYLRGPYSTELTRDAFAVDSDDDETWKRWRLDDASVSRLKSIKPLIPSSEADRPKRLELLASVQYLLDRGQLSGDDVPAIQGRLRDFGKSFTVKEIRDALAQLRHYGLIKQR